MATASILNPQSSILILGIDPGSRITGYGIIQSNGVKHSYVASGRIITKGENLPVRLEQIFAGIAEVVNIYKPHEAAIEQVFVSQNVNAALKLGQARGAAIAAMASQQLSVAEYTARRVKQIVVGYGAAEKVQVQKMIRYLLNLAGNPAIDAADALAVAICHAQSRRSFYHGDSKKSSRSKIRH